MGRSEGRPVDIFKPSGSLKRFNPLETGVDELTRSTLLKLLLHEAEKSCPTRQGLDRLELEAPPAPSLPGSSDFAG